MVRIRSTVIVIPLVIAGMIVGCANLTRPTGYSTWRLSDPPQRSFDPAPPQTKPQQPATQPPDPGPTQNSNKPIPDAAPQATDPEVTIRQRLDGPAPSGPSLGDVASAQTLQLDVRAPATSPAGEPIQFEITFSNHGLKPIPDVVLECEFDGGLEFPGSDDHKVRRSLGTLAAGATQTSQLTLTPLAAGQHCSRFQLSAQGLTPVERDVCVRVEVSPIEVQTTGPDMREVGQRAEYVLTILNRSGRELNDCRVQVRYDAALAAREASAGVERGDGQLTWALGALQREERVQIQMEFDCLTEKPRACVSVRVTSADMAASQDVCVDIQPRAGEWSVTLSDGVDPVAVGDLVVYRCDVTNRSSSVIADWSLEVTPAEGLTLESPRVIAPTDAVAFESTATPTGLTLGKLPPLPVDGTVTIELPTRAAREGRMEVQVKAVAPQAVGAAETAEVTVINPPAAGT